MPVKLYAGNVSPQATSEDLQTAFSEAGTVVSVAIQMDQTGKSRGFAFVEMETEEGAVNALKQLSGRQIHGQSINLKRAGGDRTGKRDKVGGW